MFLLFILQNFLIYTFFRINISTRVYDSLVLLHKYDFPLRLMATMI